VMAELQDKFTQTWMQESAMHCSLLAMGSSLHGPHPKRSLPAGRHLGLWARPTCHYPLPSPLPGYILPFPLSPGAQVAKAMYGDMADAGVPRKKKEAMCSWCFEHAVHFFIKETSTWLCDACKGRTAESPKAPDCMARLEGSGKGKAVCAKSQSDWEELLSKKKKAFSKPRSVTKIRYEMTRDSSFRQQAQKEGLIRPFREHDPPRSSSPCTLDGEPTHWILPFGPCASKELLLACLARPLHSTSGSLGSGCEGVRV